MRFERSAQARRGPGLTPLIDVVFLLLVFFMLASRFDREALLPLLVDVRSGSPGSAESTGQSDSEPFVVEIDLRGQPHVAGRPVANRELARQASAAAREERPVRVRPAPEADLQAIVDVLAAIGASGASDVALERTD